MPIIINGIEFLLVIIDFYDNLAYEKDDTLRNCIYLSKFKPRMLYWEQIYDFYRKGE